MEGLQRNNSAFPEYSFAVFETVEVPVSHEKGRALDPFNKTFLSYFMRGVKQDGIKPKGRVHSLPDPREKVVEPEYDADFAICLYNNLDQVGPEIGWMIVERATKYHHIFIVTQHAAADDLHLKKGLSQIVQNTYRGIRLIDLPYPEQDCDPDNDSAETFNIVQSNKMSFWGIDDIRNPETRELMLSYLVN